jgi:hypothetical protein
VWKAKSSLKIGKRQSAVSSQQSAGKFSFPQVAEANLTADSTDYADSR